MEKANATLAPPPQLLTVDPEIESIYELYCTEVSQEEFYRKALDAIELANSLTNERIDDFEERTVTCQAPTPILWACGAGLVSVAVGGPWSGLFVGAATLVFGLVIGETAHGKLHDEHKDLLAQICGENARIGRCMLCFASYRKNLIEPKQRIQRLFVYQMVMSYFRLELSKSLVTNDVMEATLERAKKHLGERINRDFGS